MRLIDADRAKDAIYTDFWEHFTQHHDSDQTALIDMVMDDIDETPTVTPSGWVSVNDRLPEPEFAGQQRGFYLVALSNGVVKELMYEFRHYENMMFNVGWHETAYPVTHWMPLPAPPDLRPPEGEDKS